MSQQVWCWGRDILRPEGNWLLEVGFDRLAPPADLENCSSAYVLELPRGRRVALRGFGTFYGDDRLGGVFVPRYEFRPEFTTLATLPRPPWTKADLPELQPPTGQQAPLCASLTQGLIGWIEDYEQAVADRLGGGYRHATLERWDDGKRTIVPADDIIAAWRSLGVAAGEDFREFV